MLPLCDGLCIPGKRSSILQLVVLARLSPAWEQLMRARQPSLCATLPPYTSRMPDLGTAVCAAVLRPAVPLKPPTPLRTVE